MKRIFKIISAALVIGIIPFSITMGQENKGEQKIKIVVSDGSDTKVLIDTVFSDGLIRDSIKLKDGKYIFIGNRGENADIISKEGSDHLFVTVTSDSKGSQKEVRIVKSDPVSWTATGKTGNIYIYSDAKSMEGIKGEDDKMMSWSINDQGGSGEKVIVINDGKVIKKDGVESYTYTIKSDKTVNKDSDSEITKYVISKDGMTISVEGNDYAKVKKIADEIGGKINSNSEETEKKAGKKK